MNKSILINKINEVLNEINSPDNCREIQLDRQSRLQSLVDIYDIDSVALAAGYTNSTLHQYLRVVNPSSIGEESVKKAEYIFDKIN